MAEIEKVKHYIKLDREALEDELMNLHRKIAHAKDLLNSSERDLISYKNKLVKIELNQKVG